MAAIFRTRRVIEFVDTDMAGIVHFSNFFRFMEATETAFLRTRGMSVADMMWEGQVISFPRVAVSCDYHRPVHFQDVLDIDLHVERIGTRSITYKFEFLLTDAVVATGRLTTVCCHVPRPGVLKSIPIPEGLRQRLLADGDAGPE
jgi:4-hydroxybenzoyl-CoA thioesterase/acyl-CoA thioester hydrolase